MSDEFILLVDNDKQSVDLLKLLLEYEDYKVDAVYSAEAALSKVKFTRYSHFVLDFAMPGMKGDKLAARIRVEQPEACFMLVTGFGSALGPSVFERFDYVFEKPVNPRNIIQAIKQWHGRSGSKAVFVST